MNHNTRGAAGLIEIMIFIGYRPGEGRFDLAVPSRLPNYIPLSTPTINTHLCLRRVYFGIKNLLSPPTLVEKVSQRVRHGLDSTIFPNRAIPDLTPNSTLVSGTSNVRFFFTSALFYLEYFHFLLSLSFARGYSGTSTNPAFQRATTSVETQSHMINGN
jgi:hypothetical protein